MVFDGSVYMRLFYTGFKNMTYVKYNRKAVMLWQPKQRVSAIFPDLMTNYPYLYYFLTLKKRLVIMNQTKNSEYFHEVN